MRCEIARIVERAACVGLLGDADEFEDGKGRHGALRYEPIMRGLSRSGPAGAAEPGDAMQRGIAATLRSARPPPAQAGRAG